MPLLLLKQNLIYGNSSFFERLKVQVQNQPITQEAIAHNLAKAEEQKEYLSQFSFNDKRKKDCSGYIQSFSQNAEQLALGNKSLILKNLKQIYGNNS